MTRALALGGAALALGLLATVPAGQSAAQDAAPEAGQDGGQDGGQASFREHCGLCHQVGGFGTRVLARRMPAEQAPLEARSNLTAPYIELVVRRGLGSMPQIRRAELDDATLRRIATYLEARP